ncbi:MFS transporter [Microvirga alba]|uniref:MFS transporter n=1 Tax=Microvirga alba TaxID=2791025 RepID=A0A931BSQ3_9HYPH|nr:MFS transporter [Microvirga alba]MBF9234525.1 MFS transporter [Microvirga alba]
MRANTTSPPNAERSTPSLTSNRLFSVFCLGGYLLSISYGTTFLLALLVASRGGNEGDAGLIISTAIISTIGAVILSGHFSDAVGAPRAIAVSGVVLCLSCLGFATAPGVGIGMLLCGFLLGCGWGVFYTLGPIVVATIIEPARRIRFFALLSGSMMSGIGTGPILGRIAKLLDLPLETTYLVAAATSLAGGLIFLALHEPIRRIAAANGTASVSRLSLASVNRVLRSKAVFPIVMVGLGGAIFGGLSSFQTSYATAKGLDFSIFFIGFMSAAIGCRMFLSGIVTRQNPHLMATILTFLIVVSILMFWFFVSGWATYLVASVTLGVGYGLTYSVINGLAANEAPPGETPQSLLLFSLAYFIGVFGYPLLAGKIIVASGIAALLLATLCISLANWGIAIGRLLPRMKIMRESMPSA